MSTPTPTSDLPVAAPAAPFDVQALSQLANRFFASLPGEALPQPEAVPEFAEVAPPRPAATTGPRPLPRQGSTTQPQ